MPVFDFTHTPDAGKAPECTYTIFQSNEKNPTVDNPLMVLETLEEGRLPSSDRIDHESGEKDSI